MCKKRDFTWILMHVLFLADEHVPMEQAGTSFDQPPTRELSPSPSSSSLPSLATHPSPSVSHTTSSNNELTELSGNCGDCHLIQLSTDCSDSPLVQDVHHSHHTKLIKFTINKFDSLLITFSFVSHGYTSHLTSRPSKHRIPNATNGMDQSDTIILFYYLNFEVWPWLQVNPIRICEYVGLDILSWSQLHSRIWRVYAL